MTREERGRRMKAIVTIIDNQGRVLQKDKVIVPTEAVINTYTDEDGVKLKPTKTTYFKFAITEIISETESEK